MVLALLAALDVQPPGQHLAGQASASYHTAPPGSALANVTNTTCNATPIPEAVTILLRGCTWTTEGAVVDEAGNELIRFNDSCASWLPSDLRFAEARNVTDTRGNLFLSTTQKLLGSPTGGDIFELRDCNGAMWAWATENIWHVGGSRGVEFSVRTASPSNAEFLRSKSGSFLDVKMDFADVADGRAVGTAFMSFSERVTAGWFCRGSKMHLSFPDDSVPQLYRQVVVALAAVRVVGGLGSWCHSYLMFVFVGLPSILVCCICLSACEHEQLSHEQRRRLREQRQNRTARAAVPPAPGEDTPLRSGTLQMQDS
jgi:hypothetical protein